MDNPPRQNFFRAGHARASVIVLPSLICQLLADAASLPAGLLWPAWVGVPAAAILIPLGFLLSVASLPAAAPNGMAAFIYVGAIVLAASVLTLGIGLLRASSGR